MKCSLHSCITIVIALLLLSVTVEGQTSTDQTLRDLFEGALLNSSESLNTLQRLYFNPTRIHRSASVRIGVNVTVDNITIPKGQEDYCNQSYDGDAAFHCDNSSFPWSETECTSGWYFESFYELKLTDGEIGTSQLSDLLTYSGSTGVFYIFDSSFYTIMESLSVSTDPTFSFGNTFYFPSMDNQVSIVIHISEDLQQMPCMWEADDALRMVLVWVSKNNS